MTKIKASLKIALFLGWCMLVVPTQFIYLFFVKGYSAYTIPYIWQRGVCKVFGIKVTVKGAALSKHHTVYCSNHTSYLDIPAIGSVLKASFVAKSEVEKWPVFGFLSKLQQTIFISRRRNDAKKGALKIQEGLNDGKNIILFPEGTSSDGQSLLPMKAAMLSPLVGLSNAYIQPFTIVIRKVDGQDVSGSDQEQALRDLYAWYGEMELAPHLWIFAQTKGAEIDLIFHDPISAQAVEDRKRLVALCEEKIRIPLVTA
jgi:1-acyl-sn-glycerol-3-phosphate acyltransferase